MEQLSTFINEKNEHLFKLYLNTFTSFKKCISKKDPIYKTFDEITSLLLTSSQNISYEIIMRSSLTLCQPYPSLYQNKYFIETLLSSIETIIMYKLIPSNLLLTICHNLLYQMNSITNVLINDESINIKILNLCYLIYSCDIIENLHNKNNMKCFLNIIFNIYINSYKIPQCQTSAKSTLSIIIDYMIKKIKYYYNKNDTCSLIGNDSVNEYMNMYMKYLLNIVDVDNNIICICCNENIMLNNNNNNNTALNNNHFHLCNNPKCKSHLYSIESNANIYNLYYRSVYRNDYITLIEYLSQLTLNENNNSLTSSNNNSILNNKELSISTIQELITKSYTFYSSINKFDVLITNSITTKVIDSLIANTLSSITNNNIFSLCIQSLVFIIKEFKIYSKRQIEIVIQKVFCAILESENLFASYKKSVLDGILTLAEDKIFIIDSYINYDCDLNYKGLFSEIIDLLSKIANGLYMNKKYYLAFKYNEQEREILKLQALNILNKIIDNIHMQFKKEISIEDEDKNNKQLNNNDDINSNNTLDNKKIDKYDYNIQTKSLLQKAIDKFNVYGGKHCLQYLKESKLILEEDSFQTLISNTTCNNNNNISPPIKRIEYDIMTQPFISEINPLSYLPIDIINNKTPINIAYFNYVAFEFARFMRAHNSSLLRNQLSEYLCSSNEFNIKVMNLFINSFNFKSLHIINALRILFKELPIKGEGQIIDRIIQCFGERYHKDNPTILRNPDLCYYIAFSIIMLNTDLHRVEIEKKMTVNEYIERIKTICASSDEINISYLQDIYIKIQNDPILIPGQSLIKRKTHSKREIIKKEKESLLRSTIDVMQRFPLSQSTNYFHINKCNLVNLKHIIEASWSNYLGVYSQYITNYYINNIQNNINFNNSTLISIENENELDNVIISCIKRIFIISEMSSLLQLDTISEAFINTIYKYSISLFKLNQSINHNQKTLSLYCLKELINYIKYKGNLIHNNWYPFLLLIADIDYYQTSPHNEFIKTFDSSQLTIRAILNSNISETFSVEIFAKTSSYEEDTIISFITALCNLSKNELEKGRVFALHKLIEVADFNLNRIQVEWIKIWKIISQHLIFVIINTQNEQIWKEALESLRQLVSKLLQKSDLQIYNFQIDFFKPFVILFDSLSEYENDSIKYETILIYIHNIITSHKERIFAGWSIVFKIIQKAVAISCDEDMISKLIDISKCCVSKMNMELISEFIKCLININEDIYNVQNIIEEIIYVIINEGNSDKYSNVFCGLGISLILSGDNNIIKNIEVLIGITKIVYSVNNDNITFDNHIRILYNEIKIYLELLCNVYIFRNLSNVDLVNKILNNQNNQLINKEKELVILETVVKLKSVITYEYSDNNGEYIIKKLLSKIKEFKMYLLFKEITLLLVNIIIFDYNENTCDLYSQYIDNVYDVLIYEINEYQQHLHEKEYTLSLFTLIDKALNTFSSIKQINTINYEQYLMNYLIPFMKFTLFIINTFNNELSTIITNSSIYFNLISIQLFIINIFKEIKINISSDINNELYLFIIIDKIKIPLLTINKQSIQQYIPNEISILSFYYELYTKFDNPSITLLLNTQFLNIIPFYLPLINNTNHLSVCFDTAMKCIESNNRELRLSAQNLIKKYIEYDLITFTI